MEQPELRNSPEPTASSRSLGLMSAGVLMAMFAMLLSGTSVTVAVPAIQRELEVGLSDLQWIVDSAVLCLSAFLLTGGAIGDRYGRKRAFIVGIVFFTIGSAICTWAPGFNWLVTGLVVQGISEALVIAGSLSILTQAYPDDRKRARVLGLWSMVNAASVVLGPVVGGLLTDTVGWRAVFAINLPLGVIAAVLCWLGIEESSDPDQAAPDPAGQVLGIVTLGALAYGLIEAQDVGWSSAQTIVSLVVGVLAGVMFVLVERAKENPMFPVRMFRNREFAVTTLASFVLGFGAFGIFFLLVLYLQNVQGHSANSTGVRFLPLTLAILVFAPLSGRFTARFGPYTVMLWGYALTGVSLLGLVLFEANSSTLLVSVVFILLGAGTGLAIVPTSAAVMAAIPRERSGIASATLNATRQIGVAMGIAVLGVVAAAGTGSGSAGEGRYGAAFVTGVQIAGAVAGVATLVVAALAGLIVVAQRGRVTAEAQRQ